MPAITVSRGVRADVRRKICDLRRLERILADIAGKCRGQQGAGVPRHRSTVRAASVFAYCPIIARLMNSALPTWKASFGVKRWPSP